jgi:hypothetical protein
MKPRTNRSETPPNSMAYVKEARRSRGWTRKMVAALGIGIAMASLVSAAAFAQVLNVTSVPSHQAAYTTSSTTDPVWPTAPTIGLATTVSGATGAQCVASYTSPGSGSATWSTSSSLIFGIAASSSGCTVGDLSEMIQFTPTGPSPGETSVFFISTSYTILGSPNTTVTSSAAVSITEPSGAVGTGNTLTFYVDYGGPPSGGIQSLTIAVS